MFNNTSNIIYIYYICNSKILCYAFNLNLYSLCDFKYCDSNIEL